MSYIENEAAYQRAIEGNIKANANKTRYKKWLEANPDAAELVTHVNCKSYDNNHQGFWGSMKEAIAEWGALTEGQTKAVRNSIEGDAKRRAEWAARDAGSQHVGVVGERQEWRLTVSHTICFYHDFGHSYINLCRDIHGNVIVYKGSQCWTKGAEVVCMARVKEHGERDGVRQTIIQRPTKVTVNGEAY